MSRIQYGYGTVATVAFVTSVAACQGDVRIGVVPEDLACGDLNPLYLADGGVGRDGIPALTDPVFVPVEDQRATTYLSSDARVIGVFLDGEWLAIPHNIMYRHEIVNLTRGSEQVAVTYCPLTGSALAFDRSSVDGAEFGVSGLLFQANLIMYDRNTDDSLWPQMRGAAACGSRMGQALTRHPVVEMTWGGWLDLFTGSTVVGVEPLDADGYSVNPYGNTYENPDNPNYLGFPIPREDTRRLPKERVLGLPATVGSAAIAFPFHAMEARGQAWVHEFDYAGAPAAVLWDTNRFAAVAVRPVVGEQRLTFRIENDAIVDNETGSTWSVAGQAVSGPLEGGRLAIIPEAYVAFWLAWAGFHPDTELIVE
ncbi:MAG: DUF3179 domain-containing protein [Gemmatimonadetes bacterium]|nr:DUF3179 domain-containing protein [Gemmatimonadota bacterium]